MRRLGPAVAVLFILVACGSAPPPVRPTVPDDTTFLSLAVRQASRVTNQLARAELYRRIAVGYLAIEDEASMHSLATAALQLTRAVRVTEEGIIVQLGLAPLLATAGDDVSALSALEAGLVFGSTADDPLVRAKILPLVVQSALGSDEPARPILRRTVDEVYIIEEPGFRAEALIRIAELYQGGGASLPVTGFLNQAIPAVRSTNGHVLRALYFTRLAELASVTGEESLAVRLLSSAITEIDEGEPPAGEDDSGRLVAVIAQLARLGRPEDALRFVDLFADRFHAARALIEVAALTASPAERFDHLGRASEHARQIEDTARFVDAHIRLAEAYQRSAAWQQAVRHGDRAAQVLATAPALYSQVELPGHLAEVFVALDRLQSVRELLLHAPGEFERGAVSVRAAFRLIADGRLGLADDFLTIALIASDEASRSADELRLEIVAGFARTGSIRLAIRTIERMTIELLRAQSVAELAVEAEPAGLITPIYRADLASVLSSR